MSEFIANFAVSMREKTLKGRSEILKYSLQHGFFILVKIIKYLFIFANSQNANYSSYTNNLYESNNANIHISDFKAYSAAFRV